MVFQMNFPATYCIPGGQEIPSFGAGIGPKHAGLQDQTYMGFCFQFVNLL